jgi:CO/xanthine dehydrogenase FAD-binding subunit
LFISKLYWLINHKKRLFKGESSLFTIQELVQPETLEQAYSILRKRKSNAILGGCAFLRLGSKRIGTGIDLSKLNLNYIKESEESIEIGAMTTFRDIETSPILNKYFDGLLSKSVRNIIGVQFRNVVTVGASVYSRYGFSDLITALLALDTYVVLQGAGELPLAEFLEKGAKQDILVKLIIRKNVARAVYNMIRNSVSDYPILNAAVSYSEGSWRIVVGARPQRAAVAVQASQYLTQCDINSDSIERAAELALKELSFGSNMRAGALYRETVCKTLIRRAVSEVAKNI